MVLPFIRGLTQQRDTTSAPNAWYKPIRATSDSDAYNAFEPLWGPPNLDVIGRGQTTPQSFGPHGAYFLPGTEYPSFPGAGLMATASFIGGGGLYTSSDSEPAVEIF